MMYKPTTYTYLNYDLFVVTVCSNSNILKRQMTNRKHVMYFIKKTNSFILLTGIAARNGN